MKWWTAYVRGAHDGIMVWGALALIITLATTGRF